MAVSTPNHAFFFSHMADVIRISEFNYLGDLAAFGFIGFSSKWRSCLLRFHFSLCIDTVHSPGGILRRCFAFTVFISCDGWIQLAASTEIRGKDGREWLEIMVKKAMGCRSRMYRADRALLPFYLHCFLFPFYFAVCLISPFSTTLYPIFCISSFPFHLIRLCLQLMPRCDAPMRCPDAIPARVVSFSKSDAAAVYIAFSSIY